jgi:hypothetical protein
MVDDGLTAALEMVGGRVDAVCGPGGAGLGCVCVRVCVCVREWDGWMTSRLGRRGYGMG